MCDYTFSEHRTISYNIDRKILELWKLWIELTRLDLSRDEIKQVIPQLKGDFVEMIKETISKLGKKMPKIKIEQNIISRDWFVSYKGKNYHVNLTYSDGQTLALLNRDYWEIQDENGEEVCYALKDELPELSEKETKEIIEFCTKNFLTGSFKGELSKIMNIPPENMVE
jgi:hypothetical protein